MAQLHAGVGTGRGAPPPAHLPAAVRHHALVTVPLGVAQLAAEAEIFPRNERVDALAAGAAPAPVFCTGRLRPLLDAMDVEDLGQREKKSYKIFLVSSNQCCGSGSSDPHVFGPPGSGSLIRAMDPDSDPAPDPSIIKQK